jgi:hypothetical protein
MKSDKQINDNTLRYLILFGLLGGLFIHSFIKYGVLNQVIGLMIPKVSAAVPTVNSPKGFMPNWSLLKFSDMIISENGKITYPGKKGNEIRVWNAGQSIAEFMELGDFETPELGIEKLSLAKIANAQGINLNKLRLSDLELTQWQTLPDLVKAVPGLGSKSVSSVKPIQDFLKKLGISTNNTIGKTASIHNVKLKNVQLSKVINLKNYSLTSVPNIENASIKNFANWQDSKIKGVPGLENLTWNNFPGILSLNLSMVGKVDLVLRDIEANRNRSISGSYQQGFNVPCLQTNCAHAEMSGIGQITGMQWISGKVQKVSGGFGILKSLNGGKEPTGRNPFGSAFKQVVWDINEAEGSMQTAMFFRICKTIPFAGRTCSPYFIGPVPFIKYREKDPIIFG